MWSIVGPLIGSFNAVEVERSRIAEGATFKDVFTSEA